MTARRAWGFCGTHPFPAAGDRTHPAATAGDRTHPAYRVPGRRALSRAAGESHPPGVPGPRAPTRGCLQC